MEETLSIKINIADKFFPLKIKHNEEETIRKAAKLINDKLTQYRQKYSNAEMTDFLSMTALHFATQYLESKTDEKYEDVIQEIKQVNNDLDEYISQNFRNI